MLSSDGSPYEKRIDAKGRVLSDECIADEVPFEKLPEGWAWARLSDVASFGGGKTPPTNDKSNYAENGVLWVTSKDMKRERIDSTLLTLSQKGASGLVLYDAGCIVMVTRSGILRRLLPVSILDKPATVNQDQKVIIPVDSSLSEWLLRCFQGYDPRIRSKYGKDDTTVESIVFDKVREMLLPLPPLAEQRRIVERVDALMPLVEGYGALEDAREELDAALPGRLRKSVLQMAVQGKLAPQDPADEPASALLERIREQRRRLVAEGKMKAPKGGESVVFAGSDGRRYEKRVDARGRESEPVCIEDEISFEIPDSWEWARLGSLCDFGKCQNVDYENVAEGVWNLDLEDIEKDSGVVVRKKRKLANERGSTKHIFASGMVLYSKLRPYLNKVIVADENGVCSSEILTLDFSQLNNEFAQLVLMEPGFVNYAKESSYGVKMPRLGVDDGKHWLVAVPPLAEQCRIVSAFKAYVSNEF